VDPIFLVEAAINGILLGGVLALLALGLNLIFGVLDIVWIAYVELVMLCMYAVYFFNVAFGWPIWAAGLVSLAAGTLLGVAVHLLIISPILTSPPINQLLATGGLLFFLQSVATFLWTTDHKTVRLSLPSYEIAGIFLPATRMIPFAISILAVVGLMAGLAGALLIFQYSVHPFFGGQFGPLTFMICVLGGLGNMVGAFIASFIMSEIISIGGVVISTEIGYVIAFVIFIVMMFIRPGGILARRE